MTVIDGFDVKDKTYGIGKEKPLQKFDLKTGGSLTLPFCVYKSAPLLNSEADLF